MKFGNSLRPAGRQRQSHQQKLNVPTLLSLYVNINHVLHFCIPIESRTSSSMYILLGTSHINSFSNDNTTNDIGMVKGRATFWNKWVEEQKRVQQEISNCLGLQDDSDELGINLIKHIHQLVRCLPNSLHIE